MKLKKIASLMLAGLMAVSMLAGCEGKGSSSSEPENPVVPTTGVVAYANDAVSEDTAKEHNFEGFAASTNLDAILNDLATSTGNFDKAGITEIFGDVNNVELNTKVQGKLNDKLDGLVDDEFDKIPADNVSDKYGYIYTVSGKVDEKEMVGKVVNKFVNDVLDEVETVVTNNTTDTKYDTAHTAEISVVKVSSSSAPSESAWVVAIVLTQEVTKVSNTVE